MNRLARVAILACAGLAASSTQAGAETIITPFVGKTFAAQTTLQTAEGVDTRKWIVGVSATWLTAGVLGAEVDLGYAPRFFDSGQLLNHSGSNATTLTGNVILAVPLSVSRESLRPYFSAGMGLLHAGVEDFAGSFTVDRNLAAISIGGGAIGFITPRAGVRFDLRHIRSVSSGVDIASGDNQPQLGFWRATVGVAIRY